MNTLTGPHEFRRLSRFLHRKKCRGCYWPRELHPVTGWVPSRPYGDKGSHPWSEPTGWSASNQEQPSQESSPASRSDA